MRAAQAALRCSLTLAAALAAAGCGPTRATQAPASCPVPTNGITQVGTIDALLAGVYDGQVSLAELRRHGNFGVGTFASLDGELVLVDGSYFQLRSDGKVYRPALSLTTPFASVTQFVSEHEERLDAPVDFAGLQARIDALVPASNRACAFLLRGEFERVKVRSVPRQSKPYPPLAEVAKTQPEFTSTRVKGRVLGFRLPPFVKGVNIPGFHVHFLADDLSTGGHVLELSGAVGTLQVDASNEFLDVRLPAAGSAFDTVDLARDRADELDRVEKSPGRR